ncbi:hypothetical protein JCM5350_007721 [Sporobolomyces pararoseus]
MQAHSGFVAPPHPEEPVPWDDIEDAFGVLKRLMPERGMPPFLNLWITLVRDSLERIWPFVDQRRQRDFYNKLKSIPSKVFKQPRHRLNGVPFSPAELFERALPPLDYIKTWVNQPGAVEAYHKWTRGPINSVSPFEVSPRDARFITQTRLENTLRDLVLCFPREHKGVDYKTVAEGWVERFCGSNVFRNFMDLEEWRKRLIIDKLSDLEILNAVAKARCGKTPIIVEKILPEIRDLERIASSASLDSARNASQHVQQASSLVNGGQDLPLQMQRYRSQVLSYPPQSPQYRNVLDSPFFHGPP